VGARAQREPQIRHDILMSSDGEAPLLCVSLPGWRAIARLGLAACFAGTSLAAPTDDHWSFQRFMPRDGLPPAVVYCGMQDSRGFLWFGTADGVARFDGRQFRVFRPDPNDPESLANGAVLGIQEDAKGDLWMATEGGLDVWRRDTERFVHYRHDPADPGSLSDDTTQSLLRDPDGTFWVGTRGGGLNHFDPRMGKFTRIGTVSDPWIRCLFRDDRGVLWIGTGGSGLQRLDPGTRQIRTYAHDPADPRSLSHNRVSALAEDRAGNLWVGTDGGLCRLGPERDGFERHIVIGDNANALPNQTVTALIAESDGVIGIGTDGGGFLRYDPAAGKFIQHRRSRYAGNSLVADAVRTIFADSSGDLWIGHFPSGVSHFDRSAAAFQVFYSVPGEANTMSDDQVLSFLEDPTGDLWVGTDDGGVNHWSAATGCWRSYAHRPGDATSLGAKAAVSLLCDHLGTLWVGTWGGGLNRFEPSTGTFRRYVAVPGDSRSLSDVHVWQMAEDHEGRLWVATVGGGVERYVPEQDGFVHHRHDPADPRSLNDDVVSSLLITRDGTLWAGTPKGLARLDRATESWDRFQSRPGERATLGGYWIFDLLEDRAGMIWATTEGGGLNRLDPRTGQCENFRTADGLPSDVLRGIIEDDAGVLWIGSNSGLVRFDPQTRQVRVFDESNGLPGRQFNPHARLRLGTGELLFGTTQGFVRFDPRQLKIHDQPPPVVLTEFEVFGQPVRPARSGGILARSITETQRLEIPAGYPVIGFQFASLSFTSPERIQFRIKLEGFEEAWRDPGPGRRATFTNLDPGHYRLRIKAANSDGVWNEKGVALDLVVVPPWWRTWWLKGGAALFVIGGAASVGWAVSAHRLREAQHARELALERERTEERARAAEALRILNQELEARVADRTAQLTEALKELEAFSYSVSHDLRAPLRSMDGFSRVLLEDYAPKLDAEGRDSLRRICTATQRMGQLIDDLLNLSRVSRNEMNWSAVNLSSLAAGIAEELQRTHPDQRMEFVITPGLAVRGDARLLRIMLENLLGNACKFSSKRSVSHIEFGVTRRDGRRTFFVRDNGAGFDMTYARNLFGAFQRYHSTAEFPGSGIGLATVQRILRRHGGEISAESQPDRGATFYFTLPDQPGAKS
jgi:two-component system sensor histidine kinase ChiS